MHLFLALSISRDRSRLGFAAKTPAGTEEQTLSSSSFLPGQTDRRNETAYVARALYTLRFCESPIDQSFANMSPLCPHDEGPEEA